MLQEAAGEQGKCEPDKYYRLDSQQPQGTDLSMQVETITYKNLSHHQNESLDWEVWRFTTVMFHHAHYIHID
jgi:hypothetical protein